MATKTITITVDAYEILKSQKGELESFSDVIKKMKKVDNSWTLKLVGLLTPKEAEKMEDAIKKSRASSRKRMEWLQKEFSL